jgi:subtilisin family serine protease
MLSALPRRALAPGIALLLALAGSGLSLAHADAGHARPDVGMATTPVEDPLAGSPGNLSGEVTLITGDRVILKPGVQDQPRVLFDARDGDPSGGFTVERDEHGIHVIPDDVAELVPEVLDPELFNVTRLVEMGYDDDSTDVLPLIVDRAPGVHRLAAQGTPLRQTEQLESIGATAATLVKSDAAELGDMIASMPTDRSRAATGALGGVTKIYLDGKVEGTSLDGYLDLVNAPEAWQTGLDGSGVTVAVLDSGVDEGHPALAGQVLDERNFTDEGTADDIVGHGTHVASLLAGNGAGADGARQGIAPAADLLNGRVLNSDNEGLESWVIAGMEWAVSQHADLVNMSLGGLPAEEEDPVVQSLEELTERSDALFVVSAGNRGGRGHYKFTINSPGTAPSALTVGATREDGVKATGSSEGPTTGSFLVKPDVLAPGVGILGARAGAREGDLYVPMTGTSMATPIVAGAAALLKQAHPAWTAEQVKARIITTADGSDWFNAWEDGSGRLDLAAVTGDPLLTDTATLDLGYLAHPDDTVQRQTVTVTNTGTEPVTLSVQDTMTNDRYTPSGDLEAAPASAVTAEPAVLEVPAGASAETVVSLDPQQLSDTIWQGVVTFRADGEDKLRLPIGVYDEPESYDLNVRVLDRNGDPYDPANADTSPHGRTYVYALNADTGHSYQIPLDADGHGVARVRAGHYSVFAHVATPTSGGGPASITFAGTAELLVDSDTNYMIDARDGRRLDEQTVAGQETRATTAVGFTYRRQAEGRGHGHTVGIALDPRDVREGRVFITPTPSATTGVFEAVLRWQLEPVGKVHPKAPDVYDVVWNAPAISAEMSPRLSRQEVKEMARLEMTVHPAATTGAHTLLAINHTANTPSGWVFPEPVELPASRTVLATARPDVFWQRCLEVEWNDRQSLCRPAAAHDPGTREEIEVGGDLHVAAVFVDEYPGALSLGVGYSDGRHRMHVGNHGVVQDSHLELTTQQGDVLASMDGISGFFPIPADEDRFRLTHEWRLRNGQIHAAPKSRTTWDFRSVPGESPMLLDADYGPDLDPDGTAAPRRPLRLDLSFESGAISTSVSPDRVTSAALWWSTDDGATWHQIPVRRLADTTFTARVPGRSLTRGADLSLRVVATDDDGNGVDQTSIGLVSVADH